MTTGRRIRVLIAAAASALAAGVASDAFAQTWDGGAGDNNWTTANNWDGNVVPANDGTADITFAGSVRTSPNVKLPQSVHSTIFAPLASPFTIGGEPLTIGAGGITNNSAEVQTFSNNIVLAATQPWNAAAGDLVVNGVISDLGTFPGLNKSGAGTLTLRGNNTFKGDINLTGGTIDVFRVSSQFAYPRTLNFNAASTLRMNATDAANFTANAQAATTLEVTQGWVSVVSLTGGSSVNKSGSGYLELGLSNSSFTGRINVNGGKLIVAANNALGSTVGGTIVSSGASVAFIGGAFGGVNYTAAEPLGISGDGHNGHGAIYNMGFSSNTFAGQISLNAASSISAETLGSSLRLTSSMTLGYPLTVRDANVTLAGNISGSNGRLIKSGAGTLTVTGLNSYGGGTEIKGGILSVNSDSALGVSPVDVTFSGVATLHQTGFLGSKRDFILAADGATVDTNGNDAHVSSVDGPHSFTKIGAGNFRAQAIRTGPVNVNAGKMSIVSGVTAGETCTASSLSVAAGAQFDLSDHNLIVTSSTLSAVESLVNLGANGGTWTGTGGIITTQANALTGLTSLGVATAAQTGDAGGTFAGISVDADDVLVMYTYAGDANLDGLISGDDYTAIDFNAAVAGATGWFNGDFNHDGLISGDDYSMIDFNLTAQGAPFPTSSVAGVTAVPEPVAATLLAMVPAVLRRRRRARVIGPSQP